MHPDIFKQHFIRAKKFHDRLEDEFFRELLKLRAEFRHCPEAVPFAERNLSPFLPIAEGGRWGESWEYAWFRLTAEIPPGWKGEEVALKLDFNGEGMIVDHSGHALYNLSAGSVYGPDYRKNIYSIGTVRGGETVELWVEAAAYNLAGLEMNRDLPLSAENPRGRCLGIANIMRFGRFRREVRQLRLDVEVLLSVAESCPPESRRRDLIILGISEAADTFAENPDNAAAARQVLRPLLKMRANASACSVTAIGHAHIDTGWLWPVRETVRKCIRTFAGQLELLKRYPSYVFGASAALHYQFVREHAPRLYEEIKAAVKSGRWELQGGMWVESDCNLVSGESLVRQFLCGKNFFSDEFGVNVKNLWLPDAFGYCGSLPQIIRKAGCNSFLSQKLSWNQVNRFPYHTFRWRGIDGSEVLSHFLPEGDYNSHLLPQQLTQAENRFAEHAFLDEFLSLYGMGDGGGGPKEEHIERGLRMADLEGAPKVRFGRADTFFKRMEQFRNRLPVWSGELYLEHHRGCQTTQARTKSGNRKLEELLPAVELLNTLLPAGEYPRAELDRIWKTVLINQFHDILPGSSIAEVYEETEKQHAEALGACRKLIERAAGKLFQPSPGALILFNSLSVENSEPVELPEGWASASGGGTLLQQREGGRTIVRTVVPPLGTVTLFRAGCPAPEAQKSDTLTLENNRVKYEFNPDGQLISACDKECGRPILAAGERGNVLTTYIDRPNVCEAWDIDLFYPGARHGEACSAGPPRAFRGALRSGIEFHLRCGENSRIVQQITLCANSKRLDFKTRVDWQETRKMLRVTFPAAVFASEAAFDIPYGCIRRPTHTNTSWEQACFEVPFRQYADLSEADYGVALLNDCKYGCRIWNHVIDLGLLRSPKFPDWNADRGEQCFTYALLPHAGALPQSDVVREANTLNRPPVVISGRSGEALSPISIEAESVSLTAFKRAEKSDAVIIRLVETAGKHSCCILSSSAAALHETDLLERECRNEIPFSDGKVKLRFSPFEIRTFQLVRK